MSFNYYFLYILDKFLKYEKWLLIKYILFALSNIFGIAFLSWLYTNFIGIKEIIPVNFYNILIEVLIVSIFPILVIALYFERILLKKHLNTAKIISQQIKDIEQPYEDTLITLKSENLKTQIRLLQSQLICIQANDNYSAVYYKEKSQKNVYEYKKELLRIPLKKIEQQLQDYEKIIVRCHKSYIVNLLNIERVSGNAQGYKLYFKNLDFKIPVSRNFPKSILDKIKENQFKN